MKIRLSSQSIRFRLSPEDLSRLARHETLVEEIVVAKGLSWKFELSTASGLKSGSVEANGTHLVLRMPEAETLSWLESKSLSWEYKQKNPHLELYVEKDVKPDRDEKMKSRNQ